MKHRKITGRSTRSPGKGVLINEKVPNISVGVLRI